MRQWVFGPTGEGLVTYLILEDQRRVDGLFLGGCPLFIGVLGCG